MRHLKKQLRVFVFFYIIIVSTAFGVVRLKLNSVDVTGVPPGPLPELVYKTIASYQNRFIQIEQIKVLQRNITLAYHKEGYFLASAKLVPQKLNFQSANLLFSLSGGRIGKFSLKGKFPGAAFWQLKRYLLEIKNDYPLNINNIQKYLLLINEIPGVKARATMYPGKVAKSPSMVVDISTSRVEAFLLADNKISKSLGGYSLTAGGAVYRLLGADRFFLSGTSDPSFGKNINATALYDVLFGSFGGHFVSTYSFSQTKPTTEDSAADANIKGTSNTFDFQYNMPLMYSKNRVRFFTGITRLESNSLFIQNSAPQYSDKITKVYIGLRFTWAKLWRLKYLRYGWISGEAKAEQGVPLLAESAPKHPSTPKGTPVFTKLVGSLSTQQFITSRWNVGWGGKFQFVNTEVLASEKLGFGGSDYGRAFLPFTYVGDNGALTRFTTEYDYPIILRRFSIHIAPFLYYDAGYLDNIYRNIVSNQASNWFVMSAGGGAKFFSTRLKNYGDIYLSLEYGIPVSTSSKQTGADDQHFFFSFAYTYK